MSALGLALALGAIIVLDAQVRHRLAVRRVRLVHQLATERALVEHQRRVYELGLALAEKNGPRIKA